MRQSGTLFQHIFHNKHQDVYLFEYILPVRLLFMFSPIDCIAFFISHFIIRLSVKYAYCAQFITIFCFAPRSVFMLAKER